MQRHSHDRSGVSAWGPYTLTLLLLVTAGCNGVWDDMTSRELWSSEGWKADPEPLVVLSESRDGDKRSRAYQRLADVNPASLPPEQAEGILKILCENVVSERQPWARMAAIQALGNWNDPKAVDALRDAYYRSATFPGEAGAALRVQTLAALGRCGHPSASEILVKVLSEPPVEGSETERQQKLEERLAAARALGRYSNTRVTGALVEVLRKDRDPGLRRRSHESLVKITGQNIPPEAEAWDRFFVDPSSAPPRTIGQRLHDIVPVGWRGE